MWPFCLIFGALEKVFGPIFQLKSVSKYKSLRFRSKKSVSAVLTSNYVEICSSPFSFSTSPCGVLLNSFPPQGGERKPKMLIPPCMIREFHLQVPPRRPAMTAARLRTTLWTTPTVSSTHAWQQQPNNPPHRLNKHGSITLDSLVLHLYTSRRVTIDVKNIHEQ